MGLSYESVRSLEKARRELQQNGTFGELANYPEEVAKRRLCHLKSVRVSPIKAIPDGLPASVTERMQLSKNVPTVFLDSVKSLWRNCLAGYRRIYDETQIQ